MLKFLEETEHDSQQLMLMGIGIVSFMITWMTWPVHRPPQQPFIPSTIYGSCSLAIVAVAWKMIHSN